MTVHDHSYRPSDRGFAVRRPRATDAVGDSLQRIFGGAAALPHDFQQLIGRLDRVN